LGIFLDSKLFLKITNVFGKVYDNHQYLL